MTPALVILVDRTVVVEDVTMGTIYVDGDRFCYSLEDPIREVVTANGWTWRPDLKIPGKTAIPSGKYVTTVTYSNRFRRRMPLLLNVPDFTAIRFHGVNDVDDTEGCIGMGRQWDIEKSRVFNTANLVPELVTFIDAAERRGKVITEIRNP